LLHHGGNGVVTREQIELRAYNIWQEAGCPEGSSLWHWLQAEIELGVIPEPPEVDPFTRLDGIAAAARAEDGLQGSAEAAVPEAEQLPRRAEESPLSSHVEGAAGGRNPQPGETTFEGGSRVSR
jgi:Protein of unknown function (DUF2934)